MLAPPTVLMPITPLPAVLKLGLEIEPGPPRRVLCMLGDDC